MNNGLAHQSAYQILFNRIRSRLCFKRLPPNMDELVVFLEELSIQITIAVDNILYYYSQKKKNERLENQKRYGMGRHESLYHDPSQRPHHE